MFFPLLCLVSLASVGYAIDLENSPYAIDPFALSRALQKQKERLPKLDRLPLNVLPLEVRTTGFLSGITRHGYSSTEINVSSNYLRLSVQPYREWGHAGTVLSEWFLDGSLTLGRFAISPWYANIAVCSGTDILFGRHVSEIIHPFSTAALRYSFRPISDLKSRLRLSVGGVIQNVGVQAYCSDAEILGNFRVDRQVSVPLEKLGQVTHYTLGGGIGYAFDRGLLLNYYHEIRLGHQQAWRFEYLRNKRADVPHNQFMPDLAYWGAVHTEYNFYLPYSSYRGIVPQSYTVGGSTLFNNRFRVLVACNGTFKQPWLRKHIAITVGLKSDNIFSQQVDYILGVKWA